MNSLIEHAKNAISFSYSPYSSFKVAAAVLGDNNQIYTGVNVENASYGLTQCAERSAICTAISSGAKSISAIVIYTPTQSPTPPCGACRQVIQEFGANVKVHAVCDSQLCLSWTMSDLLPNSFNPEQLTNA
ncbi:MAG: cytidine deaminase [Pseudohongiellaceae bacterium]|jgi:cytidine deaminase